MAARAGVACLVGWLVGWAAPAAAQTAEPSRVPIALQRSHTICPVPGREAGAWLIDDAARWATLFAAREEPLLGRAVAWGREQVLVVVVALAEQPTLGIRIALDEQAERAMFRRLNLATQAPVGGPVAEGALWQAALRAIEAQRRA